MKKKIEFSIILLAIFLGSCNFLKEDPETSLTKEAIYSTEAGVESVLTSCYQSFAAFDYRACTYFEMGSNSVFLTSKNSQGIVYVGVIGHLAPDNDNYLNKVFAAIWSTVSRTNDLIYYIQDSPISEAYKQKVIAEASFLRAVAYFDLVRTFGRVPLITSPILNYEQANAPRASLRSIYQQIIADLRVAELGMPKKGENRPGRAHAMAATAYKAKVYLSMASLKTEHFDSTKEKNEDRYSFDEQTNFFQCAYDTALYVKNTQEYSLVPNFGDLWNNKSKNTSESILEIQFGLYGSVSRLTERTLAGTFSSFAPLLGENKNQGRIRASKMLFAENWTKYGNGKTLQTINNNQEVGADPRINTTYLYYDDTRANNPNSGKQAIYPQVKTLGQAEQIYPFIRKYYYDEYKGTSEVNFIAYRYADLLLILAEAANELGIRTGDLAKTEEAITLVNTTILQRARNGNVTPGKDGLIQPADWDITMTPEEVQRAIRMERAFELVGEGHEMFDIRRYGIGFMKEMMALSDTWILKMEEPKPDGWGLSGTRNKTEVVYGASLTDELVTQNLFFPYPKKELQLNTGIDPNDQNLGWEKK